MSDQGWDGKFGKSRAETRPCAVYVNGRHIRHIFHCFKICQYHVNAVLGSGTQDKMFGVHAKMLRYYRILASILKLLIRISVNTCL